MAFGKNIRSTAVFQRKQRAEAKSNFWKYSWFPCIIKKWKWTGYNLIIRLNFFKGVSLKILMHTNSLQIYKANLHPRSLYWSIIEIINYIGHNVKYIKSFKSLQWRHNLYTNLSIDLLQLDRPREYQSFLKLESVYGHSFESFREISLGWIDMWRYNWPN